MYTSTFKTEIPVIFQYREDFNKCTMATQIWRSVKLASPRTLKLTAKKYVTRYYRGQSIGFIM